MLRAFWTGDVAFGQVVIPIKLCTATRDLEPNLHLLHKECETRIESVRRCPQCERDVPWEEIGKGIEVSKGKHSLLSEEELSNIEGVRSAHVEIIRTARLHVDLLRVEKSYWAMPASLDRKAYVLLRDALANASRTAIVEIALRSRYRYAMLSPRGTVMTMTMLRVLEEITPQEKEATVGFAGTPYSLKEFDLARRLVDQLDGEIPETAPEGAASRTLEVLQNRTGSVEKALKDSLRVRRMRKAVDLANALTEAKTAKRTKMAKGFSAAAKKAQ